MYIVRDIFHLKFGQFKPAKALLDEAMKQKLMPAAQSTRVLSDFTGAAYRLIFETGYNTLAEFEKELTSGMAQAEWQAWYGKFKELVFSSHREILKEVK